MLTIDEIREILKHHHSEAMGGHRGVNATLQKISNYYCWNGMKEDVQEYVSLHKYYNIGSWVQSAQGVNNSIFQ